MKPGTDEIGIHAGLQPGSLPLPTADSPTVAMVGAGQLAQMTHQAAISLGLKLRVLARTGSDPAVAAGAEHLIGAPDELDSLRELARGCEVLTFDHEGVPGELVLALEQEGFKVAPGAAALAHAQDKLHARRELGRLGFPVPPFLRAQSTDQVSAFADEHGWPLIAKAPRGGYDGRGVWELADASATEQALAAAGGELLIEPKLPLELELSVLVARSSRGEAVVYEPVEAVQRDAMCREIIAPARIDPQLRASAQTMALAIAEQIDAVGVLAVELFVAAGSLIVNELALRPHNTGHHTIEGCDTSQFEQHLRAVLGLPLGSPAPTAPVVVTVNVVGGGDGSDPRERLPQALVVEGAHLHLYGKGPAAGRKLGHVTVCGDDYEQTIERARLAARTLEGTL